MELHRLPVFDNDIINNHKMVIFYTVLGKLYIPIYNYHAPIVFFH